MAAIFARFKKEMDIMKVYFAEFASSLTTISGAAVEFVNTVASISGQYTALNENISGLWMTKYDLNNP